MKKILSLLSVVIIALSTFTSCDEDVMISSSLRGTWEGDMYTYHDINGRTQQVTYTEIMFTRDPGEYTTGYGYWIDHFSRRADDYYYSRIEWEVRNKTIYITFRNRNGKSTIEIYDYSLSGKHFKGWFKDGINTNTDFDLIKTRDDYDTYDSDYGYGDGYYDYYYSKATRSAGDSAKAELPEPVRKFKKVVKK